jgi:hypothetical protein
MPGTDTLSTRCVWSGSANHHYGAAYIAKVRIAVRAGSIVITREGCGSGSAKAATPGQAHELALKGAETDATKRALATFGNPFGLALYDRELAGVGNRKALTFLPEEYRGPWLLSLPGGVGQSFSKADEFIAALSKALTESKDIEHLFAVWERNVDSVRAVNKQTNRSTPRGVIVRNLVTQLKACAIALAKQTNETSPGASSSVESRPKIDKSALALSELKRIRSKEHLRFVAQQPCVICGRTPAHAHHVRCAQRRGLALKVSDEFTVPLCALHHSENHASGDERRWWHERKIDPLAIAQELWNSTKGTNSPAH